MIHTLRGLIEYQFIQIKRYWLDEVFLLLSEYVIFLLLFFGIQGIAQVSNLGASTESIIVGYWVFSLVISSYASISGIIGGNITMGTLEHLYLSPQGFKWISIGFTLGGLMTMFVFNIPFLFLLMLTTGNWLHIDLLSITPLIIAIIIQAYGIGYMMGGLSLIHKQVGSLAQLINMFFIACIVIPPDVSRFTQLLPFNILWRLLREVMENGTSIIYLSSGSMFIALIQTIVLLALGIFIYNRCENIAKTRGVLGQY
ncbi:hypothetical protein [Bacillus sp. FSL K6-3431]|uniref:hypothetical protein n=1 Tax=Bacillus sp. FSL K6-3431 TaxID=2921500 RepID=UPI0030F57594